MSAQDIDHQDLLDEFLAIIFAGFLARRKCIASPKGAVKQCSGIKSDLKTPRPPLLARDLGLQAMALDIGARLGRIG